MSYAFAGVPLADNTSIICSLQRSLSFVKLLSFIPWSVVLLCLKPLVGGKMKSVTVVVEAFLPLLYRDLPLVLDSKES